MNDKNKSEGELFREEVRLMASPIAKYMPEADKNENATTKTEDKRGFSHSFPILTSPTWGAEAINDGTPFTKYPAIVEKAMGTNRVEAELSLTDPPLVADSTNKKRDMIKITPTNAISKL